MPPCRSERSRAGWAAEGEEAAPGYPGAAFHVGWSHEKLCANCGLMKSLAPLVAVALVSCGAPAARPAAPAPSASAASSSTVSVVPATTASATAVEPAGPPADVRCQARSCHVEGANEKTLAELAAAHADLGDLEIFGGHPKSLAPIGSLTKLYRLKLALCSGISDRDFAFAKSLSELADLELSNCEPFTSLAPLGSLPKLANVALVNTNLRSLDGLRGAPVQKLRVQSGVTDLTAISSMTGLTELVLADLDGVRELPSLAKLAKLERLDVSTTDLARIPDLASLTSLRALRVSHCAHLVELKGLASLPSLAELTIDWSGTVDLAALGKLDHVTFLHLEGTKVKDLVPLAAWKSLGVVIVADDTPPGQIAALAKAKPSLRVTTAHQASLATMGP